MFNINEYPLALNGFGKLRSASDVQKEWASLVRDYGSVLTPQDRQDMFAAFDDNNVAAANAVLENVRRRISGRVKTAGYDFSLDKLHPNAELFTGLPNYYVYGGIVLLWLAKYLKKGS